MEEEYISSVGTCYHYGKILSYSLCLDVLCMIKHAVLNCSTIICVEEYYLMSFNLLFAM